MVFNCLSRKPQVLLDLQVESGDLVAYGLIPEFVGRFPVLASLLALNEDQLVQVCSVFLMTFVILLILVWCSGILVEKMNLLC
jgi:hypothetical protein